MSDSDESLDLKSEKFDPIKALYSANVSVPCTSAHVYDNVSKFSSAVLRGVQTKTSEKKKKVPEPPAPQIQRKFLPHQMPVSRPAPARTQRTVLTRMREEVPQGPLALLATCAQRRLRVKVYTRHASGVRGYAEAFVAAFDKHWNLALEDVREVWVRRRRPPVPPLGAEAAEAAGAGRLARARRGAPPPRVSREPLAGGRERCERHVPQVLLRGENVVLVAVLHVGSRDLLAPAAPSASVPAAAAAAAAAAAVTPAAAASSSALKEAVAAAIAAAMPGPSPPRPSTSSGRF